VRDPGGRRGRGARGGRAAYRAVLGGERLAEVAHDVERVEEDTRLWRMAPKRGAKGLPPVPCSEWDACRLVGTQRGKDEVHVGLGAALAADPDGPPAVEVADTDAVVVALPDGDLVHPDRPRCGQAGTIYLLQQVDRVEDP